MIVKWNEFRKIKGSLKKKLYKDFGLKKHYSLKQITSSCIESGIKDDYFIYAVAAYSNASSFYNYAENSGIGKRYKYKELRRELGIEKIDVDDDFSNPTGVAS
jgi:hypothetical protein